MNFLALKKCKGGGNIKVSDLGANSLCSLSSFRENVNDREYEELNQLR